MRPRRRFAVVGALLAVMASAAGARHRHEAASGTPGQFDYYLLTLSWSPSYCLIHPEDRSECEHRGYGFVLHGLWPQYAAGGYPQDCATSATLTAEAARIARTLYPSARLVEHEWERHGTCSGLDALSYFRMADHALGAVRIPARFAAPAADQQLDAEAIRSEFTAANPGMPANAVTVSCSRGELAEVRVCLSRALEPRACGRR